MTPDRDSALHDALFALACLLGGVGLGLMVAVLIDPETDLVSPWLGLAVAGVGALVGWGARSHAARRARRADFPPRRAR
jgi:hypothetical protein